MGGFVWWCWLGYIITKPVDLEARFPVMLDGWNVKSVKRGVKKE
jgi:hypothetical protein